MSETFALNDLLKCLVELERAGQCVYGALAKAHFHDPELYRLFCELASWEKRHEEIYSGYLAEFADAADAALASDADYLEYLRSLVQSATHVLDLVKKPAGDTAAALGLALQLEKDTVLFLNEAIPHVPPTFAAAGVLQEILREERRHVAIIQKLLDRRAAG
jgi:rubrerythrin